MEAKSKNLKKPVLVSGIQPSGRLHLGNYLGALKNFVELQNSGKYQCYFFIADLHSLTENFNPKGKQEQILNLMADYLAAGLDPKKSVIFLQSQIPAHAELAWILNTITPMGELQRMTQFKDKSEKQEKNLNVGLFDYPVLMAADILLYSAKFVPVGDDQLQHLELTRTLAQKFNSRFGETFTKPGCILAPVSRLMSLSDPRKKMSKSDPASCLFLDDSPEEIKEKIKRAVTDSGSKIKYDPDKKPAITNLIDIYSSLSGVSSGRVEIKTKNIIINNVETKFKGKNYSFFKEKLASVISDYFADYRNKKAKFIKNPDQLKKLIISGSKEASKVASAKILEVKEKIGVSLIL
ncbi:tryptophan--tRNA ligase [Patescibacteria group bacterium]|nr:tryptophan--tRNA ligase [Patescibacteria group bacterium]MCL5733631.1 tryptophan--tRNA ligase [Patescibacteria group bacterium]